MILLAVVDDPAKHTGFAGVGRNLILRWAESGMFERIDIWCIGWDGWPRNPGETPAWWDDSTGSITGTPIVRYPATLEWNTPEKMSELAGQIAQGDYTHVWVLQDHFNLVRYNFQLALRKATTKRYVEGPRKDIRTVLYAPVDGEMEPEWAGVALGCDATVAYTEFGKKELKKWLGEGGHLPEVSVIPHGVDTAVFRPLNPKSEIRNPKAESLTTDDTDNTDERTNPDNSKLETGNSKLPWDRDAKRAELFGGMVQPGDVALLNVNVHQRRKDVGRTLELFKELLDLAERQELGEMDEKDRKDLGLPTKLPTKFKLVMHMSRKGPVSEDTDLELMAEQCGLKKGRDWCHTGQFFEGVYGQLSEEDLNILYNCCDVYVTTSLGEGWGLGITEAAAAGLPVAVPEHTACLELAHRFQEYGVPAAVLPCEGGRVWVAGDNGRGRHRVDVETGAQALYFSWRAWNEARSKEPGARRGLPESCREWLSWDRIAREWLRVLVGREEWGAGSNEPGPLERVAMPDRKDQKDSKDIKKAESSVVVKRRENFYVELGGGLGDIFNGLYARGIVNTLRDLPEDMTATVALITHNPFAAELFRWHPKFLNGQIELRQCGYWAPEEDALCRVKFGLPFPQTRAGMPLPDRRETLHAGVEWYISEKDKEVLGGLPAMPKGYFVIAAGAGLSERSFPQGVLDDVMALLWAAFPGCGFMVVGRSYDRCGSRPEPRPTARKLVVHGVEQTWIDLRDKLTVPGTATLLQGGSPHGPQCRGLITAHSALNILGWNQDRYHGPRLPQLLLYPESVKERHFSAAKRDQWSWGADNGRTAHGLFRDHVGLTQAFVKLCS